MTAQIGPETPSASITVFLVDDHEVVREGLKRMLAKCDGITVVGEAGTAEEAVENIPKVAPQVVLLDLRLPNAQGLDVLRELRRQRSPVKVLVLTVHDDEDLVVGVVRAGAEGYVLKSTTRAELTSAIRRVASGGHYFGEEIISALIRDDREKEDGCVLTAREKGVLSLLAAGCDNREIADRLYVSVDTVKTHLGSIYRKLGADGRAHAVALALRRGLLE